MSSLELSRRLVARALESRPPRRRAASAPSFALTARFAAARAIASFASCTALRLSRVRRVLGAYSRDGVVARRRIRPRGRVEFGFGFDSGFDSRERGRAFVGLARASARVDAAVRARRRRSAARASRSVARDARRGVSRHRDAASNRIVMTSEIRRRATRAAGGDARERRRGRRRREVAPPTRAPREGRATREIAFRNYVPRDGALAAAKLPATTAPALDVARRRGTSDEGASDAAISNRTSGTSIRGWWRRDGRTGISSETSRQRLGKLERRTRRALVDVARDEARSARGERARERKRRGPTTRSGEGRDARDIGGRDGSSRDGRRRC